MATAGWCGGEVRAYGLLVLTGTVTVLAAGLGAGAERLTVDGPLPAKVQVGIPATETSEHTSAGWTSAVC